MKRAGVQAHPFFFWLLNFTPMTQAYQRQQFRRRKLLETMAKSQYKKTIEAGTLDRESSIGA